MARLIAAAFSHGLPSLPSAAATTPQEASVSTDVPASLDEAALLDHARARASARADEFADTIGAAPAPEPEAAAEPHPEPAAAEAAETPPPRRLLPSRPCPYRDMRLSPDWAQLRT